MNHSWPRIPLPAEAAGSFRLPPRRELGAEGRPSRDFAARLAGTVPWLFQGSVQHHSMGVGCLMLRRTHFRWNSFALVPTQLLGTDRCRKSLPTQIRSPKVDKTSSDFLA
ncbi:MAG: hypothetical protein NZ899_09010 [Thermoguttaceae bacterium]|nr:hypothetical protein [Thermoguttaceae bacterium]MDW8079897.1 hypothetical protein [Thermoguttaceae bacterium]